jgi:hypothetical protein
MEIYVVKIPLVNYFKRVQKKKKHKIIVEAA